MSNAVQKIEVTNGALTPMDMLNHAVERGAGLDVVSKLMDLQERWEKNQAAKEFNAAIAEAKAEIKPIARNKQGHNSKRYADMAAVANAVDPILSKYGLGYRYRSTQADRITVTCVLFHRAGHQEETTLSGPADTSGNKNAIQSIGSTLTYLERYSLMLALGLAAGDDDDAKASGSGELISTEQLKILNDKFAQLGGVSPATLAYFEVASLSDLAAKDYPRVLQAVNKKIAEIGK